MANNIDIAEAIAVIRKEQDGGNPQTSVNGNDINKLVWHDGNPTNITNAAILAKQAELQTAYDTKQYQRDRKYKYPRIGDQLDMIYHDQVDNTTTFKEAIEAVKDDNPKP